MGKEIERVALDRGHEITFRLNDAEDWRRAGNELRNSDIVIDFTLPDSALENIRKAFDQGLPVVTGTTGWYERLPVVLKWCEEGRNTLFVAANFSIGVNIMLHLSGKLAQLLNRFPDYKLSVEETHHVHKVDKPSGTAIKLAEAVLDHFESMKGWTDRDDAGPDLLPVVSHREGEITGNHTLRAESGSDILQIVHQAKNRQGFAVGAMMAAEWVKGRHGFFTMKELLELT